MSHNMSQDESIFQAPFLDASLFNFNWSFYVLLIILLNVSNHPDPMNPFYPLETILPPTPWLIV